MVVCIIFWDMSCPCRMTNGDTSVLNSCQGGVRILWWVTGGSQSQVQRAFLRTDIKKKLNYGLHQG